MRALVEDHGLVLCFYVDPARLLRALDAAVAADPAHSDTAQVLQLFLSPPKTQRLRLAPVADGVGERASAALSAKAYLMYMLDLRLKGRPKEALQYSRGLREGAAIIHPLRDVCDGWPQFIAVQQGVTAMLAGDFTAALTSFQEAQMRATMPGLEFLHREALVRAALIHATFGDPGMAASLVGRAASIPRTASWAEASLDATVALVTVMIEEDPVVGIRMLAELDQSRIGEMWPFFIHAEYRVLEAAGAHSRVARRLEELAQLPFARTDGQGYSGSVLSLAEASRRIVTGALRQAKVPLARADQSVVLTRVMSALLEAQTGTAQKAIALAREIRQHTVHLRRMEIWRVSILSGAYLAQGDEARAVNALQEVGQLGRPIDEHEAAYFSAELRALGEQHVPGWPVLADVAATYMDRLPNQGELLTGRELEVLRLLARGLSRQEISDTLFVTLNTLKSQLRSVYRKLGASSREEALRSATSRGLI
ncbi:LuxR C-terminal-related transcriptional regulator [Leucobacter komagatae]|uniref:LuxR C-terminal-related transcriptional regulator n=1 Tax=Leucobacter komagatae TaxID=55969 RepID=UPI001476DDDB|nr:LuxR C-terminal-related transcriptional regulator [Leucobacter komagatae]